MAQRKLLVRKTIPREILIKELAAFEKRLDMRFDLQTESLKDYVDGRFSQLNLKIDGVRESLQQNNGRIEAKIDKLDKKLDVKVVGLVELITRRAGEIVHLEDHVKNHETRITALEN